MLRFFILATCFGMAASEFLLPCFVNRDAAFRPGKGKFEPEHIIPHKGCTHLILGYAKIHPKGEIYNVFDQNDFDYYERLAVIKASKPGLKTLLSIGGPDTKSWAFSNMMKNRGIRRVFAVQVIELARQFKFDGIDLAWFYPTASDKASFVNFLQDLKMESWDPVDERYMTITATVSGIPHIIENHYDAIAVADNVDFVNVQTYDYHGDGETTIGLNAPLYAPANDTSNLNVEYSLNLWHKLGMPKNKIVMGIPAYARVWYLEDKNNAAIGAPAHPGAPSPLTNIEGVLSYAEMCLILPRHRELDEPRDHEPLDPHHGIWERLPFWYSFEDTYTIKEKIEFVMDNGYAGAFFNSLDMDDFIGYCEYTFFAYPYPRLQAITNLLADLPSEYQPSTEAPTTPPSNNYNPCHLLDGNIAWINDDNNCQKYYYCGGYVSHHLTCSEGLFWQQDAWTIGNGLGCTYESDAGCRPPLPLPVGWNFTKV